MKRIVILGSTGSIGRNVLDVVSHHPDEFTVVGLAARSQAALLAEQALSHRDARLAVTDENARRTVVESADLDGRLVEGGNDALEALIEATQPDLVVNAVVGFVGLRPTMAALRAGIPVAIANKETVVTGGRILVEAAKAGGAALIPIDSEHVAIAQCLNGEDPGNIDRVIVTASGGALRDRNPADMDTVTIDDVLAHPTWNMGRKITVDSATLVNKGLELIEAHWLFDLPYDKIDVVIHPQSIVHSMVRFVDGSIMAQMGEPDMRLPILYALSYPGRIESAIRHDVLAFPDLTFREVDREMYPCFDLVLDAARQGGNAPTVLNAANEVAVNAFLSGDVSFAGIREIIASALAAVAFGEVTKLEDIFETDAETRRWIATIHKLPHEAISNAQGGN
jgi:1-deoxy-D-xylulose-5-phosphate reductoisomerase